MTFTSKICVQHPGIVDCNKSGQQGSSLRDHRKIFLMLAHRGNQYILGHSQELVIETAADTEGYFNQVGDRIEQPLVNGNFRFGAEIRFRDCGSYFAQYFLFSPGKITYDHCIFKGFLIGVRGFDNHGASCHETVPPGFIAGHDTFVLEVNDFAVVQGKDPLNGPGKAVLVGPPFHRLGKREGQNDFLQHRGKQLIGLLARHLSGQLQILSLGGCHHLQVVDVRPFGAGKTLCRSGRLTMLVKGGLLRGS